ncbi:MAG TPA: S41 family peptidase [Candidatus Limnocylindrales bacterium]|nr:S41 family peptidase [Candidatus Limnocylindrales bacterium]
MDREPIPTELTTDPVPPAATSVVTGPSLAPGSSAAGRARGSTLRRAAIGLALVLTFSVGIGVGRLASPAGGAGTTTPDPSSAAGTTTFGLIREAWDTLHTKYVGAAQLDDKALIYGAIDGMTQAVGDTGHTSFLTPEERAARSSGLSGSYVGIGVRIDTAADGLPLIVGVFPNSPAAGAGLAVGDEIVAVDGNNATGRTVTEVVAWVRGEAGSTVKVTVRPGATGTERTVSMVRADVAVDPVSWTLVPGTKTALIRLEQFSTGAADDLIKAVGLARGAGADRIILDIRGNPGGYVNEADAVASQFLKSGLVFIERAADGHETTHPVKPGGVATDLPLVVMVDGGTASSSEIVSGALQDAGRGQLVGIKTFGTGTVLGEFGLSDGSALRVGTVEWLTPKGRKIWHQGITPDVIVERPSTVIPLVPDDVRKLTPAQVGSIADPQLARALTLVTSATAPGG